MGSQALVIAPAVREAIVDFAHAHIRSASHCPALRGRLAEASGEAWARKLIEEIKLGTFVEMDGRPCLVEPTARARSIQPARQMSLGDAA